VVSLVTSELLCTTRPKTYRRICYPGGGTIVYQGFAVKFSFSQNTVKEVYDASTNVHTRQVRDLVRINYDRYPFMKLIENAQNCWRAITCSTTPVL